MDEFNLQLSGQLNQEDSKSQINKDLVTIAKAIEKLKIQAEIDPNSVKDIAQQLSKIMNQKVVVENIQIDTKQTAKAGEQLGQNLGNSLNKNLTSSLNSVKQNIENVIKGFSNQKLNSYDLSKMFNLNRTNIDSSVIQQVRSLTNELNSLAKEALKTNSDSSWEGIVNKISSLSQVLMKFGTGRDLSSFKESLDVLDYFQNKKIFVGDKSEALANAGTSIKELNNQFRNLGVTFTTVSEGSTKLDSIWTELFNISPNLRNFDAFGDQLNAIVQHLKIAKEAMYGDSNLQPINSHDVNNVLLDWLTSLENTSKKLTVLRSEQTEFEQQIAQTSTSTTNTIVQNEEKKQQALQKTANIQRRISESESLIKSGANVTTFEHTNNAAKEAQQYFKKLLEDENAVISVSERFGELNGLTSFTVNVKRATGEVESLRYALNEIKDANGNGTGEFYFANKGGELNNANAIKQIQAIENALVDYTAKLAQFKSTNSEILSGLSDPIADFENKLSGLKNGSVTIDEVKNSFKSLNTEASNITANFSRQLSPIDNAIRNLAKGTETLSSLRAEIKGLNNAPKEINTELNKCASLLEKVKQIESEKGRTSEWSQAYREWSNSVDALKAKIITLKKEQSNVASTQVFKIGDLKNNDIAYMSKVYNTIEKQISEINKMANAKGWNIVDISGVEQADGKIKQLTLTVQDAEGALKRLTMQREKLQGNGKAQYGLMQVGDVKVIETASQAQEKLAQSAEKANAKLAEQVNKIQLSMDTGETDSKIDALIARTSQWTDKNGDARISTQALTEALGKLSEATNDYLKMPTEENQKRLINANEQLSIEYKKVASEIRETNALYAKDSSIASLRQQYRDFYNENGKAHKLFGSQLKSAMEELAQGSEVPKQKLEELKRKLVDTKNICKDLGLTGQTWLKSIGDKVKQLSTYLSGAMIISKATSTVRNEISELKELDSILTEISKTADLTSRQLKELGDSAFESASKYGRTASDYLIGVQEMYRAGFNNAEEMARLSLLAQAAGDMESNAANDYLMATNAAYGYKGSVEELNKVLDSQNYITNNAAVSMQDMADATSEAASISAQYGVNIDELSSLIAVAVSKTRESGAEVGNALKSIFITLQDTTSKPVVEAFDAVGISMTKIVDGSERLKTPIELLKELSVAFNELPEGDTKRANILTDIGKKYHANTLSAILSDWESYESMLNLYSQGLGSAAKEAEKSANNIEGSFNKLKNTWIDTVENVINSEAILAVTKVLNSMLSVVDKITSKLGSLGTIGTIGGAIAGAKKQG